MSEIEGLLERYITAVETEMRRHVPRGEGGYRPFYGMLHYHLGWADAEGEPQRAPRGKRVRSALCLMACEAVAGTFQAALPAAASLELLHEFSLIHDDIEDGDRERRHRPTMWVQWGMPQALNAGDGLFALSQLALLKLAEVGVPPGRVVQAQMAFNETAVRLCEGQYLDMGFERATTVDPEAYQQMIAGKTAALLGLCGFLGALAGGAEATTCEALREFGEGLGLAFQMQDDLLGLWGDPAATGKPVGNDIRRRKKSLPVLLALHNQGAEGARLRELYTLETLSDDEVDMALRLIEETGARNEAQRRMREQHQRAFAALEAAALEPERLAPMTRLAEVLLQRTY